MHGIGNDYIYIHCPDGVPSGISELSIEMSRRHESVGSDGIILILPSETADFMMRIYNADGSEARMCGNGIRCVGKFVYDKGLTDKTTLSVETLSGIKTLWLHPGDDGLIETVTVDMGMPSTTDSILGSDEKIESEVEVAGLQIRLTAVSMGNPHGIVFVNSLDSTDVHGLGRQLELNSMWPDRANIEFAEVTSLHSVEMRVWERGSGETMACGTGACAAAEASVLTRRCEWPVNVKLLGGTLRIDKSPSGSILMTGPAATVFEGRYLRHKKYRL
ncbi:MAG: diaminopimelate epimerase [Paramuribaculum sp.]|nr:diaminopimelate epimerase [Paramuribaculum sp.]MDE6488593.1 diaminopimelate epimerase [Paramuribaculum sp.]